MGKTLVALSMLLTLAVGGCEMGKAKILNAQGEGLYTIEVLEDRTRADVERTLATQRVQDIDAKIIDLETELASAQSDVDSSADSQDQAISVYQADPTEANRAAITQAGEALIEAAAKRDAIARNIGALKAERLSLQKRIALIDALPSLRQQEAWCADYTEDLSGEVATAEVPGEIGRVLVKPGFSAAAAWSPSDDGAIQPALSGTPAGVFYNLAMMPGWQKWRPTFRIATVSNVNGDLCDITLDTETSSQQGLNVNAETSYSGVPITYMECNGGAFENGDRALVAFSGNTLKPMVVGFESNPKICDYVVAFRIGIDVPTARGYSIAADECMEVRDPAGASTRAVGIAYLEVDRNARLYTSSSKVAGAQKISDLGSTFSGYGFDQDPLRKVFPELTTYFPEYEQLENGICTITQGILGVTKVAGMNAEFTEFLGGTFDATASSGSISLDGQLSEGDAGIYNVDGTGRHLVWPGSVGQYTKSASLSTADLEAIEVNGQTYNPDSILKVVDADYPVLGEQFAFSWFPKWMLVRYKRAIPSSP